MDGNTRFEFTSASPDSNFAGNYQNGQRGYSVPSLGRSSSFREGSESRSASSVKLNSRVSVSSSKDGPALSQSLMLEPIDMGIPKYGRLGELRRLLSSSVGSILEENSLGATHLKNSPPMAVEELKRLRASVEETYTKASGRAKILEERLNKLYKFFEATPSKKQQQRIELLSSERASGSTLKIGSQMHRNPSELGNQKFDDRPKNIGLNKRLRTSVSEMRAECRNSGITRQPLMAAKDRDLLKDNNADSDVAEEKIRRLPAGGEGWEKKMKRKRSVGAVFSRSADNDGEMKRNMHYKLPVDSSLQSNESIHGFRSVASGGCNKLEPMPSPAGSTVRINYKNEQEKPMLSRELSGGPVKERTLGKVNVKLSNREDNPAICSSPVVKGKAARAPRSGSVAAVNSAASSPHMPGTLESWEQSQGMSRPPSAGGVNNRKRSLPAGSSSPPITKWGGQRRPQKISRPRRTNLIPVSNHDDILQSEGCSSPDLGPRISAGGTTASLLSKSAANGNQNLKVKTENVSSPARLSESEESGAGETQLNDKGVGSREMEEKTVNACQNAAPFAIPMKKNKFMVNEDTGDGVRRQGRSGRVSPFSRASISPMNEKVDNVGPSKPFRNARPGSDKTGSKSGRPSKKLSDRKGFSRLGHMANGGSPDCSGESDDDREELIAAANLACCSNFNACSSAFWKTFEPLFASVDADEKSYLLEQLKLAEESRTSLSQNSIKDNSIKDDNHHHEEIEALESISCQRNIMINESDTKGFSNQFEFIEELQKSSFHEGSDAKERAGADIPLYQRVLSALIVEDEVEETGFARQCNSVYDPFPPIGTENKLTDGMFFESVFGAQTRKAGNAHKIFPCNGNTGISQAPSALDHACNGELMQRDSGYIHSDVEVLLSLSGCGSVPQSLQANNNGGISSSDFHYEQQSLDEKIVLELHSIGVFLDTVPVLDDSEEEVSQEIAQLEKRLHGKIGKKKTCLEQIYSRVQDENGSGRDLEQIAMDRLVELAYRKILATRRSYASKYGIPMVSTKQAALSFVRRTLARCHKFEDSGENCFAEPAFREILYAAPPRFTEAELLSGVNPAIASDGSSMQPFDTSQAVAKNGPVSDRGKKREVLLDDVGGAVLRTATALGISGSAKGKRSERDRDRVPKTGRLSMGGSKGERRTKSKPKQKTGQLSTSGNTFVDKFSDGNSSQLGQASKRKDVRFMSNGPSAAQSQETKDPLDIADLPLGDINGIDDLDVDAETGAPQDINSWFNFEVDGLQDHNSEGLAIPMDDLSELHMF